MNVNIGENNMIKVIFFDVDGTLLSHTKTEISMSTRSSLDKLREKGIRRVVATGRHTLEMETLPVNDIDFDGYITLNGQLCLDDKRAEIYGVPIVGTEKAYILKLFEEKKIPVMLVERDAMYMNFVDSLVEKAQQAISTEIPELGKYTGNEIFQAVVYVKKGEEGFLRRQLPNSAITRWNNYAVDIIPSGGGKVSGIKQYLMENGINQWETMAFGDGENDIGMLQFVEIGVAMGNSGKDVKAAADYVTLGVDDDGIEKALRHYRIIDDGN